MGGFGSGRLSGGGREKVEVCRSIDVNRLRRSGALSDGWSGIWEWTRSGEQIASISMRGSDHRIVLIYRSRIGDGDWQDVEEAIAITWTLCRFGGKRPYFVCPGIVDGVACRRRTIKLYCGGRYYLCRNCYRLKYASQSEDRWDRASRRANKIRMQLGGEPGMCARLPSRPKGMWATRYQALIAQVFDSEAQIDERLGTMLNRMKGLNNRKKRPNRGAQRRYWR